MVRGASHSVRLYINCFSCAYISHYTSKELRMVCCALRQTVHDASLQELHDLGHKCCTGKAQCVFRYAEEFCFSMAWVFFFNLCCGCVVIKWLFGFPMSGSFHQSYMLIFQCLYHLRCEWSQWVAWLNKTPPSLFNITRQGCSVPVHSSVTSWLMSRLFVWCGAIAQIRPGPSIFEVPRSHTIRHTPTHTHTRARARARTHARTHTHAHTHIRIHLNEWSACDRRCYVHNTRQTQQTYIHTLGGIRTRDPNNQTAADLRLRLRDRRVGPWRLVTPHSSQVMCCRKQW
jgi:hypothetical protein